jgi:hypothetical protein
MHGWIVRAGLLGLVATLVNFVPVVAPAQAADPPPETSTPVVTPPVWQKVLPDRQFVAVSDEYAMHRRVWNRDGVYSGYPVVRLSDGVVVQAFKPDPAAKAFPRLSGDAILQDFTYKDAYRHRVDVIDAETGALRGSLIAPNDESHVASEAEWMLTLWKPTPDTTAARLRFLDGRTMDVDLPDHEITGTSSSIGVINSVLYLRDQGKLVTLDLATGEVTRLVGPDATDIYPYGSWNSPFLTGDRIVQLKRDYSSDTYTAFWYDAATLTEHRTALDLRGEGTIHPFGNDLAQAVALYGQPKTLHRIDLDTGAVTGPLGQAIDVERSGAGRLVVTLDQDPDDGLGVVADDGAGVRRVADLPRVPEWMSNPWLDGDTVSAMVGANDAWPMSTSADGATPWVEKPRKFTTAGDARVEEIPDPKGEDTSRWQLSWPGGFRVIEPASKVTLGHGGELVVIDDKEVQRVRPAADGSVDVVLPAQQRAAAADGSWVWLAPDSNKVVRGFDADDPSRTRAVQADVGCSPAPIQVRDGFLLITCSLGWSYVVDLSGKLPTWRVPISNPGQVSPKLGNGFVAWTYMRAWTPEAPARNELRIADLTAEHRTTVITDVGGLGHYRFGVDEAGGRRVAYQNNSGLIAVRDVTRADATAPVTTAGGLDQPSAVASGEPVEVRFTETWRDAPHGLESASGLATIDVRRRTRTANSDWSEWQTTAERVSSADATVQVQPGTGVCFSSRARDKAGNVSDWSEARCTVVDGEWPKLGQVTGPARLDIVKDSAGLRFGYGASDDFGIASYDVQTRVAAPGRLPGAWTDQVLATTSTALTVRAAAGSEWCVRFRARDVAGHVTDWSAPRCTAVAYDDRALAVSGATARKRSTLALHGTVTVLKRKGATATMGTVQRGRTLAVWVLRGPGQGALDVRVGTTKVGRIRTAAPTSRRVLVALPLTRSGPVRFVVAGARPVRFDGFGVGR